MVEGRHHIMAFDVVDGSWLERERVFHVMEPGVSDGFRLDVDGNIWTSAGDGIHVLDPDGVELGRIVLPEEASNCTFGGAEGRRLNSPNDIIVASDGAIWFTDPPYGILDDREGYKADSELGGCFVFRLDRSTGELTVATDALVHPNGLALSLDERTLYVSDTGMVEGRHHIMAFDVVDGSRLEGERVFHVMEPGVSDGFRLDVDGNIWTSAGDGIHVLDPDGVELGRIVLPEEASNCTFGGAEGRRLFVTATSTLWSIEVGIRGALTPWVAEEPTGA